MLSCFLFLFFAASSSFFHYSLPLSLLTIRSLERAFSLSRFFFRSLMLQRGDFLSLSLTEQKIN